MGPRNGSLKDEELYVRLRQAVADMPDLRVDSISLELAKWLAEVTFLVEDRGDLVDTFELKSAIGRLGTILSVGKQEVPLVLYRVLAKAEATAPSALRGSFIAAGRPFDALAAVSKLLGEAESDVLVVDAYAEANLLDAFLRAVPDQVGIRVLADAKTLKPTLKPAAEAWVAQYGVNRPLEIRVAPKGTLHDRLILLDRREVWLLGQSFNQLATRSNTYLSRSDAELAAMKVSAYEAAWSVAAQL